ncbi:MAG: DUF3276 family protein [Bacteroidaceae bacterium]|nr:DUF3276 family protein [Bacteroidaceae bacterium]
MQAFDKNTILFSRAVKAGRRVYYIDVKSDRNGEYYLSMTESKRVYEGTEATPPVLEKHKIFLYREDFEKFGEALKAAFDYVSAQRGELSGAEADAIDAEDFKLDVEF